MANIIAFLGALPGLIKLINQLMAWINHVSGNDPQGFVKSVADAFAKVNAAQTPEERQNAAKSVADLIARLG